MAFERPSWRDWLWTAGDAIAVPGASATVDVSPPYLHAYGLNEADSVLRLRQPLAERLMDAAVQLCFCPGLSIGEISGPSDSSSGAAPAGDELGGHACVW